MDLLQALAHERMDAQQLAIALELGVGGIPGPGGKPQLAEYGGQHKPEQGQGDQQFEQGEAGLASRPPCGGASLAIA